VLLSLALRVPFVRDPLGSDESGLLLVVRHFGPGPAPYGDYWVDRPPLLLGYFWLADRLAGVDGVRLLGCLVSVALVATAAWAGRLLAGNRGAVWAGVTAAVLGSSYAIAGHVMNGMLQAATLSLVSCTLTVAGLRSEAGRWRWHLLLASAGAAGVAAALVKQSFVCGLAFGAAVVVASRVYGDLTTRQTGRALACVLGGVLSVVAAVVGWSLAHGVTPGELWFAVVEFRVLATGLTHETAMAASRHRIDTLTGAFLGSGLAVVAVVLVAALPRLIRDPVRGRYAVGVGVLLLVAAAGILGGGSWWRHYLVQLVPAAVLGVALLAPGADRWARVTRAAVRLTVVASLVGGVVGAVVEERPPPEVRVGRYLAAAAEPHDTAVVTWGHAEVLLYSGLESPYPHLWSLPARTLDRNLSDLTRVVTGPRPPTWLVEWRSISSWDGTGERQLARAVEERYRLVGRPCGQNLYLLRGAERQLPPVTCATEG
jgi:4-amino-4-deoxy-L-arabinose transferase-like glycosyltransferase